MAPKTAPAPAALQMPVLVFGLVEVRRLRRELEALEEFMQQAAIRSPGSQAALPRLSRLLDAVATDNRLQLLRTDHRQQLKRFLTAVERQAPRLHISFAVDPSSAFTAKIVTWLRANVHPLALLEVGLQPTIAMGCVVRTPNKIFDLSLRQRFMDAEDLLMKALGPAADSPAAPSAAPAEPAAPAPGAAA